MEEFVHRRNIERFKRLLQAAVSDADRARIASLLAEEEEKDSIFESPAAALGMDPDQIQASPDQTDTKGGG